MSETTTVTTAPGVRQIGDAVRHRERVARAEAARLVADLIHEWCNRPHVSCVCQSNPLRVGAVPAVAREKRRSGPVTSSYCGAAGCVWVQAVGEHVVVMPAPASETALVFTWEEWDAFCAGVRAGEFDRDVLRDERP